MKKFFVSAMILICAALALGAESERKFLGIQFALGTGFPFYGDGDLKGNQHDCMRDGYARVILYEDFGLTLRLTEQFFVLTGIQSMQDFTWSGPRHSNHAHTAFFAGVQFYPGIGNLSFSLSYALGFRRDWDTLPSGYRKVDSPKWGNGFRLSAEYDFKKGGGVVPGIGMAYTFMPTGNNDYDNLLALYFRLAFR